MHSSRIHHARGVWLAEFQCKLDIIDTESSKKQFKEMFTYIWTRPPSTLNAASAHVTFTLKHTQSLAHERYISQRLIPILSWSFFRISHLIEPDEDNHKSELVAQS